MEMRCLYALGATLLVMGVGCSKPIEPSSGQMTADHGKRLQVVASFMPVYAHAARVAGNQADVTMLLKADSGPHDYQLSPADVKRIADADLFLINGAGIEEWLDDLVRSAGSARLRVVDTGAGVEKSANPAVVEIGGSGEDDSHGHDHGEGANPHIWLDPVNAMEQTRAIARAFIEADPENAEIYQSNANQYLAELGELDRDFRAAMAALPGKDLITFHDAFPYLAKRYGMNYVGCIEAFPEKDPTPAQLKSLVRAIQKHQVKVLFAEVGYSPSILKSLAGQTGARVVELDTLEVGEADPHAYIKRMRNNLRALQNAWQ